MGGHGEIGELGEMGDAGEVGRGEEMGEPAWGNKSKCTVESEAAFLDS